ncbi:MAG: ComF family protein [Sulfitobacter sp.]|nr:ComF family protein [Sulfitobacter sp.]
MLSGIQTALDAIYPARCLSCGGMVAGDHGLCGPCWRDTSFIGSSVCEFCGTPLPGQGGEEDLVCDDCLATPRPWQRGRAALLYRDVGRKLILSLKHGDRQEIALPAALWMAQTLGADFDKRTLIAPVPLHWTRLIKRRYNQSALLSSALARHLGAAHCPDLLVRHRRTRSLDGLGREARAETLEGTMRVHPRRRHRLVGRKLLLVDDVMTSGATLATATGACLEAGSGPVCVVTLARVTKET